MSSPEQTAIILKHGSLEAAWQLWGDCQERGKPVPLEEWEKCALLEWVNDAILE